MDCLERESADMSRSPPCSDCPGSIRVDMRLDVRYLDRHRDRRLSNWSGVTPQCGTYWDMCESTSGAH
jgi:hypothetical protein